MSNCIDDAAVFESDISMVMRIDSSDVAPELIEENMDEVGDE